MNAGAGASSKAELGDTDVAVGVPKLSAPERFAAGDVLGVVAGSLLHADSVEVLLTRQGSGRRRAASIQAASSSPVSVVAISSMFSRMLSQATKSFGASASS